MNFNCCSVVYISLLLPKLCKQANESGVLLCTHLLDFACLPQWEQVSAIYRTFAKVKARQHDSEFMCYQISMVERWISKPMCDTMRIPKCLSFFSTCVPIWCLLCWIITLRGSPSSERTDFRGPGLVSCFPAKLQYLLFLSGYAKVFSRPPHVWW